MICPHSFFKIDQATKLPSTGAPRAIVGVEVVCVNCGQVRAAFVDGSVDIRNWGNSQIDEDASHS